MAFGLSFGSKKQKINQTTAVDKTETGSQNTFSTQSQQGLQSTNSTQTGQSIGQTSQQSAQSGSTQGQSASQGSQQQTTRNFSDATVAGLESVVNQLLASQGSAAASPYQSNFDKQRFIDSGMQSAQARTQTALDESLGGIYDSVGGRNNSATALLANRVNREADANLAGIFSALTGQAEEIARNNAIAGSQTFSTQNDLLGNLLQSLRGGVSTTAGTTSEQQSQAQQSVSQGSETGQSSQSTTQTAQSQTFEQMTNQLAQLIDSLTRTVGTENTKGTTKSGGFGIGLSG